MQIDYQPGWQQKKHLQEAAEQAGVSIDQYLLTLIDNAVLAEMLQAGLDSPASELTREDFDKLRNQVRGAANARQAS